MDPSFRLATETDADLLLEMMREYYAHDGHTFDPRRARIALLAFLRPPHRGIGREHDLAAGRAGRSRQSRRQHLHLRALLIEPRHKEVI